MKTSLFGECTYVVQVRFAGQAPKHVACGKPGTARWSTIRHCQVFLCDEHTYIPTGRYLDVGQVRRKMNHMSFELPIPGVW